jgi:prepilin-type N-terminal cleavage/methylation domain-containing protein
MLNAKLKFSAKRHKVLAFGLQPLVATKCNAGGSAFAMQLGFNAKTQRCKGAKVETEIDFGKTKGLFSAWLRRQSDPVILRVFAPWRLCVEDFNGMDTPEGGTPNGDVLSPVTRHAFTLIEVLVVVVLMSFIILALMAVFNGTQTAFRASLTQTDVLEGGRSAMGMIKSDLEAMTPSYGRNTNQANGLRFATDGSGWSYVPVNFQVGILASGINTPLLQSLAGSSNPNNLRTNVLESFFILTRQNTTWTGVGYVVDTTSTNYFNPLYRFSMSTNAMAADPTVLFNSFLANLPAPGFSISPTNPSMSHLMDGVVDLRVRAFDPGGHCMTNYYYVYNPVSGQNIFATNINNNLVFWPVLGDVGSLGEVGLYMFSNAVPASVEINLGVLEDRVIQRAQSLPNLAPGLAQSNYLARQAGAVHVFRQRAWIRGVDPSAYQP